MPAQRPVFFDGRDLRRLSPANPLDSGVLDTDVPLTDGSRPFTAPQAGVDPAGPADFTTRAWALAAVADATWMAPVQDVLNTPPLLPLEGQRWLVGAAPTGAWSGQAGRVAVWRNAAWVFVVPVHGSTLYNRATSAILQYDGVAWVSLVSGLAHNALSGLQGGTTAQYYHLTSAEHGAITGTKTARHVFAAPGAGGPGDFRALVPADISGSTADGQAVVRRAGVPTWDALVAGDVGAVPTTRAVNTGDGLSGGGALSADLTLSWNGLTVERGGSGAVTRRTLNVVGGAAEVVDADPKVTLRLPDPRVVAMVFGG
jgi:hypothetical protein